LASDLLHEDTMHIAFNKENSRLSAKGTVHYLAH